MPDSIQNCLLVDVRTPGEFASGHIESSYNVPLSEVESRATEIAARAQGRDVMIVCRTGQRAQRARKVHDPHLDVPLQVLEGGVVAWAAAGRLLTVPTPGRTISLERQVRIAAGALVFTGAVLAWFVHPAFVALSGFVGAGLVFAGVTDTCAMGMLIARMPWNQKAAGMDVPRPDGQRATGS